MKKLTHKEILDYLRKESILYEEIEDEDDEGELVITGIKLNTIGGIISNLKEKQRNLNNLIKELKAKIYSKKGGVYFEKLKGVLLNDQYINFEKDCYFLDCKAMIITNCFFSNSRKRKGDSLDLITIVNQSRKIGKLNEMPNKAKWSLKDEAKFYEMPPMSKKRNPKT